MTLTHRTVLFKGRSLSLAGRTLKPGDLAPNFHVCNSEMGDFHLSDLMDRVKIITSFISLDTPVCDLQVKYFNKTVSQIGKDVQIVGISKDLPFAQKRFCSSFSIGNVQLVSDFKTSSFGINYGLLIREWNLLARAVVIIDSRQWIRYIQIVPEITNQPDYDDVLKNLEAVIKNPHLKKEEKQPHRCVPCTDATPPLTAAQKEKCLSLLDGWRVVDNTKLVKEFRCNGFATARDFINWIGIVAEEQGHHPMACINDKKVSVTLTTHAVKGLTENDFVMAHLIDEIEERLPKGRRFFDS
ncbi:MAG: lipid hydroperoxide peroxidase [Parachlamydiales bacterium]|nr:lipid hydroperoxide peroxidase [Parachlamydiales bacterium]